MDQTELDLREILQVLRRRLWLIVLVPVVAAVTAGVVSLFVLNPVYRASTTLWVIKDNASGQLNYNDILMNQNLTKTYAEVAKSKTVVAGAIDRLGLQDMSVENLQEKLTVTAVRDTQIISFAVQDQDPALAATLADAVSESFKREIVGFMKVENVRTVDQAIVPTSPIKPRPAMNTAIAFVLGTMAAVGGVFLLEMLDTSLKTQEDVTRHLGLPVLGTIPLIEMEPAEATRRRARSQTAETKTVVEK